MLKKKKSRRSQAKYPALDPHLNLKTRFEQLDFDYVDKLPEEWIDPVTGKKCNPKEYLNNFTNEYLHADFFTNEKRIHKKKKVEHPKNEALNLLVKNLAEAIKELNELINNANVNNILKTKLKKLTVKLKNDLKKLIKNEFSYVNDLFKRDAEHRNNSRNRCVLTRARAQGKALGFDDLPDTFYSNTNTEDEIIDRIDSLNASEKLKTPKDEGSNS